MDSDKVVLTNALLTLGSTVATSVLPAEMGGQGALPSPKLLIGTGLTFFGLSVLVDIEPAVGVPLTWCVGLTALMWYGIPILDKSMGVNPTQKGQDSASG
jgi:hypothetical protein